MPSLLDTFLGNADQTQALGGLFSHMMAGNTPGGFQAATSLLAGAPKRALEMELLKAQVGETQAQAQERVLKAQREHEAMALAARKQSALPSLFGGGEAPAGAMPGGEPGAAPQFGQFNVQAALQAGFSPKEIMEYAALRNANQDEVARVVTEQGPGGSKLEQQYDKFGRKVGGGIAGYVAPQLVNQGDRQTFVQPAAGVSVPMNMSFADKNAAANLALSRQRLSMEQSAPRGQIVETDAGFMLADPRAGTASHLTGPDGKPLMGKSANRQMTDSQAKANLFGTRMHESNRILSDLEGKYSPMAVNSKMAAADMPGIGATAGYVGNLMLSEKGQQAEQAQRDFINATLRRESGAVISPAEFSNGQKQYFPQPGDGQQVLAQKKRNRELAIRGMAAEVPGGLRLSGAQNEGGAGGGWSIQKVN
jgi:hypothetical protein